MITEIISLCVVSYLVNGCASKQDEQGEETNILKILKDAKFINKDNKEINSYDFFNNEKAEVIGLYFSAAWCAPCRNFTPKLAELYEAYEADGKKFKVVFVSSDSNQKAFDKYFKEMPWYALDYNSDLKNILSNTFEIKGIPALLLFDKDGKLLSKEGTTIIGKVNQGTGSMSIREQIDKILEEERMKKEKEKKKEEEIKKVQIVLDDSYPNAIKTESGLRYIITEVGKGDKPAKGQTVSVHYTGKMIDGTKFDSSRRRGTPFKFKIGLGKVIKGWDEGIMLLNKGSKATLIIPPELGYGERGAGGVIPPNAFLIFEVEIVDIKKTI
jgi:FKBP-type peptidyl-prolyl cis-trans isomerase